MMQALDFVTGMAVAADDAMRERRYVCPECGKLVNLRVGRRKVPHFAHYCWTRCTLAKPEGPRHQALKLLCKKVFAPWSVAWEAVVGDRRADVIVDGRFVVECQASPLGTDEWRARTESHNRRGFPVLWLWDVKRLCRKNTLAEAEELGCKQRAIWVPAEIRVCHAESRGFVFVGDKHGVLACTLRPAPSRSWAHGFWGAEGVRTPAFLGGLGAATRFHFSSVTMKMRLVGFEVTARESIT